MKCAWVQCKARASLPSWAVGKLFLAAYLFDLTNSPHSSTSQLILNFAWIIDSMTSMRRFIFLVSFTVTKVTSRFHISLHHQGFTYDHQQFLSHINFARLIIHAARSKIGYYACWVCADSLLLNNRSRSQLSTHFNVILAKLKSETKPDEDTSSGFVSDFSLTNIAL